jgi:hypothetical protein
MLNGVWPDAVFVSPGASILCGLWPRSDPSFGQYPEWIRDKGVTSVVYEWSYGNEKDIDWAYRSGFNLDGWMQFES